MYISDQTVRPLFHEEQLFQQLVNILVTMNQQMSELIGLSWTIIQIQILVYRMDIFLSFPLRAKHFQIF